MKKLIGLCILGLAMVTGNSYAAEVGLFCACVRNTSDMTAADDYCSELEAGGLFSRISRIKTGDPSEGVRYSNTYPAIQPPTTALHRYCDSYLNGVASCTQTLAANTSVIPEKAYACFGQEKIRILLEE